MVEAKAYGPHVTFQSRPYTCAHNPFGKLAQQMLRGGGRLVPAAFWPPATEVISRLERNPTTHNFLFFKYETSMLACSASRNSSISHRATRLKEAGCKKIGKL